MKTLLLIMLLGFTTLGVKSQDLRSLLNDAASTSNEIKQTNANIEDAKQRAEVVVNKKNYHNSHPCTYPEGHPEVCDAYERERVDLDNQSKIILDYWNKYDAQLRDLKTHLSLLNAKIRLLESCNCNSGNTIDDYNCLQRCYDGSR